MHCGGGQRFGRNATPSLHISITFNSITQPLLHPLPYPPHFQTHYYLTIFLQSKFTTAMDDEVIYVRPPTPPILSPRPIRILVQTLTHLVPSDKVIDNPERDLHGDKLISMLDRICKLTWGIGFTPRAHRFYSYGDDEFGYNHRPCFFLVDCGEAESDDDVPVRCYEWDGGELYVPSINHSIRLWAVINRDTANPCPNSCSTSPCRKN